MRSAAAADSACQSQTLIAHNVVLSRRSFFKNPLPFTGPQRLRWGGKGGRVENITGRLASDGVPTVGDTSSWQVFENIKVLPAGSAW